MKSLNFTNLYNGEVSKRCTIFLIWYPFLENATTGIAIMYVYRAIDRFSNPGGVNPTHPLK